MHILQLNNTWTAEQPQNNTSLVRNTMAKY